MHTGGLWGAEKFCGFSIEGSSHLDDFGDGHPRSLASCGFKEKRPVAKMCPSPRKDGARPYSLARKVGIEGPMCV